MKKIVAIISVVLLMFSLTSCSLVREKDYEVAEYRTTMQYYDDFKILQLTDIHLGVESDIALQLDVVRSNIRKEKPDLVVVTGDSFMYSSRKIVKQLIKTLNEECARVTAERENKRICKFAFTFGNHDNQGSYPRYFINKTILKYTAKDGNEIGENKYAAFVDFKNDSIFGLTNYYIDLVDDRTKSREDVDVIYRLHIIDSNSYALNGVRYGYGVIHEDQLEHAKNIYDNATADKDYIGIAFFHIPLVEFKEANEQYLNATAPELVGQGEWREKAHLPYANNGAYTALKEANISAFFVGHDHKNYGDIIYNADSANVNDKAIFSYGVKCTNQLYHDADMMGYKTITLKSGITEEEFLSVNYIRENIKNITTGGAHYE